MNAWRKEVRRALDELRDAVVPERREKAAFYFPSSMEVLGVPVPPLRRVVRRLSREFKQASPDDVMGLGRMLLDTRIHEARQVAFELIGGRHDLIAGLDGPTVEALGAGNDNWASVDCFCVSITGQAWRDGRVVDADVRRWAASEDRWWRRTAVVSTVPLNMKSRGGRGDPSRTLDICARVASDRDAMVAKGLSWALRSLVPVDPDPVRSFIEEHGDGLQALVRREVTNKLSTGRKNPRS